MSSIPDFTSSIARDTRYFPALVGALILLGALLFSDKLTQPLKDWFVPSLAVYVLGASLIGYVQTMLFIRRQTQLPTCWFAAIVVSHVLWLGLFIGYNLYRGSL